MCLQHLRIHAREASNYKLISCGLCNKENLVTLSKSITVLCGADISSLNIPHIQIECE